MPVWAVERWRRQAATSYSDLSEPEKNSDREIADKVLRVIELLYKAAIHVTLKVRPV